MTWAFVDCEIEDLFAALTVPDVWGRAWSVEGRVSVVRKRPRKTRAAKRRGVPPPKGYVSPYRQRRGVRREWVPCGRA